MEARTRVVTLDDSQTRIVDIRADLSVGDATLRVHGLNSTVSRETRDRVRAAIRNSGLSWPEGVVRLTASTAHPRSDIDLAAAAATLLVIGAVPDRRLTATALIGELGLDGAVRPVPDVRTRTIAAAEAGLTHLVVPAANAAEAGDVPGLTIIPVACLDDLVSWLRGGPTPTPRPESGEGASSTTPWAPEAWTWLAPTTVRAAAVAAAGGHHTLHVAAPGAPVLLLPRLIRTLMADLTATEALEVSPWHFLAGEPWPDNAAAARPPGVSLLPDDTIAAIAGSLSRPGAADAGPPRCPDRRGPSRVLCPLRRGAASGAGERHDRHHRRGSCRIAPGRGTRGVHRPGLPVRQRPDRGVPLHAGAACALPRSDAAVVVGPRRPVRPAGHRRRARSVAAVTGVAARQRRPSPGTRALQVGFHTATRRRIRLHESRRRPSRQRRGGAG